MFKGPEKSGKPEKSENPQKSDKSDKSQKPEKVEKLVRSTEMEKLQKPEQPDKAIDYGGLSEVSMNASESTSSAQIIMVRPHKSTYLTAYTMEVRKALDMRKRMRVEQMVDGVLVNITPRKIRLHAAYEQFQQLLNAVRDHFQERATRQSSTVSIESSRSTMSRISRKSISRIMMGGLKISLDDILSGIGSTRVEFEGSSDILYGDIEQITKHTLPFIKITFTKSNDFLLYTQHSATALRGTEDGNEVEFDNRLYEYLTIGKGKVRRRADSDSQTRPPLMKSREMNTTLQRSANASAYVSNFEMFDTYKHISEAKKTMIRPPTGFEILLIKDLTPVEIIANSPTFKIASIIIRRLLASNVHKEAQMRFRNMVMPERLNLNAKYRYTARKLFQFLPKAIDFSQGEYRRRAVSDISFCRSNSDIFAVSYGIYSYSAQVVPPTGFVCIWSIKNPGDPERVYSYPVPVESVKFSPFLPSLIAIGLYDGSVELRDIASDEDIVLAVSQRSTSPNCDPVIAIKWIKQAESEDDSGVDPILTLSQDGSVTKYRCIKSPYLLGFKQMVLDRIEGRPEGLPSNRTQSDGPQQANRHPQGINFTMHPTQKDIYFLLTDEGCLHKCSTNYTHQYLEVWKAHEGSVNSMDFSPWSPKLFLTCGNDWCIRIWMDGIIKPLITLKDRVGPIHCAYWSRTHSTIIISLNRKTLDIWDFRRTLLNPVSSTKIEKSFNTMFKFSRCGRSLAVGNERGVLTMCALDEFPFPPHFQYDELEKSLQDAIATSPELIIELKSVGFFGYPKRESCTAY